jgi:thiamine-monophosphate kinase
VIYKSREEKIIGAAWRALGAPKLPPGPYGADTEASVRRALLDGNFDARSVFGGPALFALQEAAKVPLGDDCAVWNTGKFSLLSTTDMLVEGTHFILPEKRTIPRPTRPEYADPRDRLGSLFNLGWKSLAVNVSDIAACGGLPVGYLVSLGIPPETKDAEISAFTKGVAKASRAFRVRVFGGDLVSSQCWIVSVTVLGIAENGLAVGRAGAAPGDHILVTGDIGLARTGMEVLYPALSGLPRHIVPDISGFPESVKTFTRPVAQIKTGRILAARGLATAMLDTSDSIAKSVRLLCEAGGTGCVLELGEFRAHPEVERYTGMLEKSPELREGGRDIGYESTYLERFILDSAEDYQLLFTVPPDALDRAGFFAKAAPSQNYIIELYRKGGKAMRIGEMTRGKKLVVNRHGKLYPLMESGFEHFGKTG